MTRSWKRFLDPAGLLKPDHSSTSSQERPSPAYMCFFSTQHAAIQLVDLPAHTWGYKRRTLRPISNWPLLRRDWRLFETGKVQSQQTNKQKQRVVAVQAQGGLFRRRTRAEILRVERRSDTPPVLSAHLQVERDDQGLLPPAAAVFSSRSGCRQWIQ